MEVNLPYLSQETDRHGNIRLYVRRDGRRVRLRVTRSDPGFIEAYKAALECLAELTDGPVEVKKKTAVRGTLGWLASLYFGSEEFLALDLKSQATRRGVVETCLLETVRDSSQDLMRDCPLSARRCVSEADPSYASPRH